MLSGIAIRLRRKTRRKGQDMLRSMTGFASATGHLAPHSWTWELRAVNGKGQDFRLRIPEWLDGLEIALRKKLSTQISRGSVTLVLKVSREDAAQVTQVQPEQLSAVLSALVEIETRAKDAGLTLGSTTAAEIAGIRGVVDAASGDDPTGPLVQALIAQSDDLIRAFNEMRTAEGKALESIISSQLDEIETLVSEADSLVKARQDETRATLQRNLARVMENTDGLDADRMMQELALIAVKSDVTEEIDRLRAHLVTARALVASKDAVGRQFVFLTQEFVREANTLCSKSQNADLTRCGLALKVVIDQMREQVQNVE